MIYEIKKIYSFNKFVRTMIMEQQKQQQQHYLFGCDFSFIILLFISPRRKNLKILFIFRLKSE